MSRKAWVDRINFACVWTKLDLYTDILTVQVKKLSRALHGVTLTSVLAKILLLSCLISALWQSTVDAYYLQEDSSLMDIKLQFGRRTLLLWSDLYLWHGGVLFSHGIQKNSGEDYITSLKAEVTLACLRHDGIQSSSQMWFKTWYNQAKFTYSGLRLSRPLILLASISNASGHAPLLQLQRTLECPESCLFNHSVCTFRTIPALGRLATSPCFTITGCA